MAGRATRFQHGGTSLRYPREVGTDEVPNYITFRPTVVDFGTYESGKGLKENYGNSFDFSQKSKVQNSGTFSIGGSNLNLRGSRITNPFEQIKNEIGGIFDNLSNGVNAALSALSDPFNNFSFSTNVSLFGGALEGRVNLGGLNLDPTIKVGQTKIEKKAGINLYLPPEISHTTAASYQQSELGGLGSAAVNALDQGFYFTENGTVGGAAIDTTGSVISGLINDVTREGRLATAFQRSTGRVSNNYTYTIFKGMQHRKFSYSFRLIARNPNDSIVIKDICDAFMFYMLPVRSTDNFHHYDIPCMWEIGYYKTNEAGGASLIEYLDQPNNCFLENVSITYGKDAMGQTYSNGAPVDVTIKLSFMEIEPLLRTDKDIRKTETLFSNFQADQKTKEYYDMSSGAG